MDLKQIEKLMAAMERSSIRRLALKQEGFEIELERGGSNEVVYAPQIVQEHATLPSPQEHPKETKAPTGKFVTSPMVGTYYSAPSPEDPPFVKVGDRVEEDTVLCIIEAMKVMNEVKSGVKGTIVEVLLKNGDPVEFGSNIFRIE